MDDSRILVEEYGRLYFCGISTGELEIHFENDKYIVLKERGHTYWAAMGYYPYARAQFRVLEKLSDWKLTDRGREIKVRVLLDFPVRKPKRRMDDA